MKSLAPAVLLCAGILVQGCSIAIRAKDIEPTDLSSLEIGATRAAIEGVLGEPIAHQAMPTGTVATYRYDGGSQGESWFDPKNMDYVGFYGPFLEPILTPIALSEWQKRIEGQTGYIMIVYGMGEAVEEFTFIHGGESGHVTEALRQRRPRGRRGPVRHGIDYPGRAQSVEMDVPGRQPGLCCCTIYPRQPRVGPQPQRNLQVV
jgi:hypothetical protein